MALGKEERASIRARRKLGREARAERQAKAGHRREPREAEPPASFRSFSPQDGFEGFAARCEAARAFESAFLKRDIEARERARERDQGAD